MVNHRGGGRDRGIDGEVVRGQPSMGRDEMEASAVRWSVVGHQGGGMRLRED